MSRPKATLRLVLEPIAIAVALAMAVRSFAHVYVIPSESMVPTLQIGDHILVTSYLHGIRPQRGDVVVFRSPAGGDELLVKRIVALPGDVIESRAGRVIIGGHAVAETYLRDTAASGLIPPQIVPQNSCFVMGDNRANSSDSRTWGALPAQLIVGKARLVLWSSGGPSPDQKAWAASTTGDRGLSTNRGLRLFAAVR